MSSVPSSKKFPMWLSDYDDENDNLQDPRRPPVFVPKKVRKTSLMESAAVLTSKAGKKSKFKDVIKSNEVTVLFFGSPHYKKSLLMTNKLKVLQEKSLQQSLGLAIIYIPMFTYHETVIQVEDDFQENHGSGEWWMLGFKTYESLEAVFMHEVRVVPTLVVVDSEGVVITECGQNDLAQIGNDVLITWF